jgi:hypothetical protein
LADCHATIAPEPRHCEHRYPCAPSNPEAFGAIAIAMIAASLVETFVENDQRVAILQRISLALQLLVLVSIALAASEGTGRLRPRYWHRRSSGCYSAIGPSSASGALPAFSTIILIQSLASIAETRVDQLLVGASQHPAMPALHNVVLESASAPTVELMKLCRRCGERDASETARIRI